MPRIKFFGQNRRTGRNSAGSIFLDLCNFDLDLWDFLFGFVGLIKLLWRGGLRLVRRGQRVRLDLPALIHQRLVLPHKNTIQLGNSAHSNIPPLTL